MERKRIKSYVLRRGRMSDREKRACKQHWHAYGLSLADVSAGFESIFENDNPVVMEIGFGTGENLVHMAQQQPQTNFLGVEVFERGVAMTLNAIHDHKLDNVRILRLDAVEVLAACRDNSLHKCCLFFPDPWHKRKHNKRRLVTPKFLTLLSSKLCSDGVFHFATDWVEYANTCEQQLRSSVEFSVVRVVSGGAHDELGRAETKFERRGLERGYIITDIVAVPT